MKDDNYWIAHLLMNGRRLRMGIRVFVEPKTDHPYVIVSDVMWVPAEKPVDSRLSLPLGDRPRRRIGKKKDKK